MYTTQQSHSIALKSKLKLYYNHFILKFKKSDEEIIIIVTFKTKPPKAYQCEKGLLQAIINKIGKLGFKIG